MKISQISVSIGCTINIGNFESIRIDLGETIDIENGEDVELISNMQYQKLKNDIKLKSLEIIKENK